MSSIQLNTVNLNHIVEGEGPDMILLHGWGQNIEMMKPISDYFKKNFKVYTIDFPGFGGSSEPVTAWSVEDYAVCLRAFVEAMNIDNPIIIGHSFGCRVAIHYAVKHPVKQMLLTGAAGLKDKHGVGYYVRIYTFKALKHLTKIPGLNQYAETVRKAFGSADYKNTTGVMRTTFVKVVNDDVKDLLKDLHMPVLLVFGQNDDATPLWMGEYMEKHIPDAGLVVFENAGHYAYLEQLPRFLRVCDAFFNVKGD